MNTTPSSSIASAIASILIVEDSVVQRAFAVDMCRQFGIETIHQAGDGRVALELLNGLAEDPDIVLVDLEMPGMDGVELLQEMHSRDIMIPVVIVSGRDVAMIESVARLVEALGLPLLGGLVKPLKREALQALLQAFATGS